MPLGLLAELQKKLTCAICHNVFRNRPMLCKACHQMVGCGSCMMDYFNGDITKCCPNKDCENSNAVSNTVQVKGLDELLEIVRELTEEPIEDGQDAGEEEPY